MGTRRRLTRSPRPTSVPRSKAELLWRFRDQYGIEHRCRTLLDCRDGSAASERIREVFDQRCLAWVDVWTTTRALDAAEDLWRLVEHFTRKARVPHVGEGACVYTSAASMLAVYLMFAARDRDGESSSESHGEG